MNTQGNTQGAASVKNIFGPYIVSMLKNNRNDWNSGGKRIKDRLAEKRKERELFQIVDDYIEQA